MAAPDAPIQIDMADFKRFARQLRVADPLLKVALLRNLRGAGKVVQVEAKKNAAFSHELPPKIKVAVSGLNVYVQTTGTPIHVLEEFAPGSWMHPVFGNTPMVSQKAHPYLYPAVKSKVEEVALLVSEALEESIEGFIGAEV